ncbi:hypothetical protein DIE16_18255 [Burkholderia sp. Bp9090]|uniref:hypothetical protein n=1 Tax=Burkholderia sp. Bp8989 TaxID=2184551 RepID=UPI000F5B4CF8|nr:hypothetical protein [Burkholderia sp. Bp8989]RQS25058.1 hypothetical protein DIE05_25490 [Burkholderia sp. Bp8995]RQS32127.1 hypothetical protein DIE01_31540 [Burkholderia sp. Bp8990]RQS56555.1 hypothetical protein DID98_21805 [Burkholderia sp. Bp8984]RQZ37447.1 hypothetical protein DIE16_18255 [Burkholderia sp. Bp9090]RQS43337.1 hypothetical protein DIE00_23955 [Burkholderia sp. Bp8989]
MRRGGRSPGVAGALWRRDVGREAGSEVGGYRAAAIELSSRDFMLSGFHLKRLTTIKRSLPVTDQNGFADRRTGRSMTDCRPHRKIVADASKGANVMHTTRPRA